MFIYSYVFSTINAQQQIGGNIGLKSGVKHLILKARLVVMDKSLKQFYTTKTINGSPNLIREWSVQFI